MKRRTSINNNCALNSKLEPTADIAINKNRLKSYGSAGSDECSYESVKNYFLKDGTEFQIELFNPTNKTYMAMLNVNGTPISQSGLVLKPGVRVFLERYIDVANKFRFDTYNVSGSDEVVKAAIENNGNITVEFHMELIPKKHSLTPNTNSIYWSNQQYSNDIRTGSPNPFNDFYQTSFGDSVAFASNITTLGSTDSTLCNYSSNLSFDNNSEPTSFRLKKARKSTETGRVELGGRSNQSFTSYNGSFEQTPSVIHKIKLLPESTKTLSIGDIKTKRYCSECGSKTKQDAKFCSNCGTKQ